MMTNECSHPELVKLAAQVVEKILKDPSLSNTLNQRAAKDCPPHTLCCSKNHVCVGHGGFICSAPYRCQNGFEEKLHSRGFAERQA